MSSALRVLNIEVAYQGTPVVNGLSFELAAGEIGCLLGASGCGKSTVLRAIAGFESITNGKIGLNGSIIATPEAATPAEQRQIGMVFQDYALFPHLTVIENIGFGLRHLDRLQRRQRIEQLLELVGLSSCGHCYPHELSGGQQQRVALARALATKPKLMLLDEPFSNLDSELRERLSCQVRQWLKSQGTTALLVTHDQREAFAMADRIGLLHNGQLQQWDTPYNLYHRPRHRKIASFIGEGVFISGTIDADGQVRLNADTLLGKPIQPIAVNTPVDVLIRPDDIINDDDSPVQAQVLQKVFRGASFLYTLQLASGERVLSLVPSHHNHETGTAIGIRLEMNHVIAFPK